MENKHFFDILINGFFVHFICDTTTIKNFSLYNLQASGNVYFEFQYSLN